MNIVLLSALTISNLPSSWHIQTKQLSVPDSLTPGHASTCIVDVTCHFVYTPEARIDVRTGEIKRFWIYDRRPDDNDPISLAVVTSWHPMDRPWDVSTIENFFYAKGDEIGLNTPMRMTPRRSPPCNYMGKIGGPAVTRDRKLKTYLRDGITWLYPTSPFIKDQLDWSGRRSKGKLLLYGKKPEVIALPKTLEYAIPITCGIIWGRKVGYILSNDSTAGAPEFYYLDFSDKHLKVIPIPSSGNALPSAGTYFPIVLNDESICVPLHGGYARYRPAMMKYRYGTGIYNPTTRKWKYYDGLVVWGTSHDNHLVAFSEYPWKTIQVARVDAPNIR